VNYKSTLKSSVAAAALFAIAAPVAPSVNAADDTLKSGNKNSLTISGQVVRSLFYGDDGQSEALFQADGSITQSRVRWVAKGTVNESVTMGATVEVNTPLSNNQAALTLNDGTSPSNGTDNNAIAFNTRHTFIWVNHKRMGKISLGHTNSASNGRSETTFSGVNMAADSGGITFGSGISFIDTTTGTNSISTVQVGDVFTNQDGRSRTDVLRYDTPRFGGMALAASSHAGGGWDVGADYRWKNGPVKFRAQAQYNNISATSATIREGYSFSAAALHDSGLNGAFAFGKGTVTNATNPKFIDFDVGYRAKIFGVGSTNFSLNIQHSDDVAARDSDARSVGITAAQIFTPVGASMALTYKNYSFDTSTNTFEDVDVLSLQTIFSF